MSLDVGTLNAHLKLDSTQFTASLLAAQAKTREFSASISESGKVVSSFGSKLMLGITAPLTVMGGVAVKTAASFDDSMRQVQSVTGATGDQFEMLRQQAIDLGADTAWSASESASAMKYLGMAGLTVNEVYEATPQMLSLASAGVMDLATAAEIATNVLSGFNLKVEDLAHVSDVLAQASRSSNTSVEQLGSAMAYVGPVASAANQSLEMTTAAIQVMSNAGIQGTMAGTALRGALTSLMTPTSEARDILASYGITAAEVNPEINSLSEIIDVLGNSGISSADAMALFGDRAGPAMLTLLAAGSQSIDEYTASLEDCDGVAQEMAETMEGGAGGAFRQLEGQVETLSITFGDLIADAIMPVVVAIGDMADWLSHLDEGTQRVIVVTAMFAAGLGPALWAVGRLASGVGTLITVYGAYQASTIAATIATKGLTVAIMTNPVGLAAVGVTALAVALLPLILHTNDARDSQVEYNKALADAPDATKVADDELNNYIETLIRARDETRASIDVIEGNITAEDKLNRSVLAQIYALKGLTDEQKVALASQKKLKLAEEDAAIAIYKTEQATRKLASGAKMAYDEASKSVTNHKKEVSRLQSEYDDLKDTIDRALGIDKEIEVAERGVERADISLIRAKRDLENIRREIEEARGSGSTEDIAELRLRERTAILDVAEAEDRYAKALAEASEKREDRVDIEKKLDGDSIESAQARLETLAAQLETEQTNLENALAAKEKAQIAHENFMTQINSDALDERYEDWESYEKKLAAKPAIAATYHVDYDSNGNVIGGKPNIPQFVDIPVESYEPQPTYDTPTQEGLYNPERGGLLDVLIDAIGGSLPTYNALPSDGLSNVTRGSTVGAPSGTNLPTELTYSPTVVVNAQTNATKEEIAMVASREVGRLYTGGFGI